MSTYLNSSQFLILDCQTSGMHPKNGHLIEIAWTIWSSQSGINNVSHHYVKLPDGELISKRISNITGITDVDVSNGKSPGEVCHEIRSIIELSESPILAFSHYANFERLFLQDLFEKNIGCDMLPFEILCSQKMSKRLFPNAPCHSLTGIMGYLGFSKSLKNRARLHVEATAKILIVLFEQLATLNIHLLDDFKQWYSSVTTKIQNKKFEYKIHPTIRLQMPQQPGIYKMIDASGEILYIGKAKSLKNRVNSYFRGQKKRDKRILEMLSHVHKIDIVECDTVLEAAIHEADLIKLWNPSYNINLKSHRMMFFYHRDFRSLSKEQDNYFNIGPFRPNDAVDRLIDFQHWMESGQGNSFIESLAPESIVQTAIKLFCDSHMIDEKMFTNFSMRSLLCFGLVKLRHLEKQSVDVNFEKHWLTTKKIILANNPVALHKDFITPEHVRDKLERLILRAAIAVRRRRQLSRLMNTTLYVKHKHGYKRISFTNGRMNSKQPKANFVWQNATIAEWDRMTIVLTYLSSQMNTSPEYYIRDWRHGLTTF